MRPFVRVAVLRKTGPDRMHDYKLAFARQFAANDVVELDGAAPREIDAIVGGRAARALAQSNDWAYIPLREEHQLAELEGEAVQAPVRIAVVGPESVGKSECTRALARDHRLTYVREYVRPYLDLLGRTEGTLADIVPIARGQLASEDALGEVSGRHLICDTTLVSTVVWSETLFGECPDVVWSMGMSRHYDLVVALSPEDIAWTPDPQRCQPNLADRRAFLARCLEVCRAWGIAVEVVAGSFPERQRRLAELVVSVLQAGAAKR